MSWLRGVVKEVPSGDTVVIVGNAPRGTAPPEKRLTLSSLIAPKLGKRDGSSRDEPFAWQSREFLRRKLIGQPVVFKTDYTLDNLPGREFGSVFLEAGKENIAVTVVANGWAKVRAGGSQQSPFMEELKKSEEAAQLKQAGVWNKDTAALAQAVRDVPVGNDAFNATNFYASVGKGTTITGIIEQVTNGSMLRVTLLPDYHQATVCLCGVQAPSMGRRPVETEGEGAAPAAAPAAEPFAREAKFLADMRVLNREVTMTVEGVDKYNNLFATVMAPAPPAPAAVPAANGAASAPPTSAAAIVAAGEAARQQQAAERAAAAGPESLAELLVRAGYAKVVDWSANLLSGPANARLRDMERAAKQERRALWANWVPPPTTQGKASDQFTGKVVEVVSGDCIVVKDANTGLERRVQLSSLRAPRMGTRDRAAEPWGTEAKEFLRKKAIGREVEVKMEYTRKVPAVPGEPAEKELGFGNVELLPEAKGEEKQNLGEAVVARGFATLVKHRADEERSSVYEKLAECEDMAKGAKRGLHSNKEPAPNRINDVSQPGNATKAKQYLPFFQRAGKMQAIVDYVLSGHRLKLLVPKEGVSIVFAPSGIKTPQRAQAAAAGRPAVQGEPFADEAIAFTREHCMQRECEVVIEAMDRGGTFLGTITVNPATSQGKQIDLPIALLRSGLARLQPNIDPSRLPGGLAMADAQRAARDARLKIWQSWTAEMEAAEAGEDENGASNGAGAKPGEEVLEVLVTEVSDANEFYVQLTNEPRVQWIQEQLRAVASTDGPVIPPELKLGDTCLAQFSLDSQWYRAYVERINMKEPVYDVYFIDYGNREKVASTKVRTIDKALAAVPPQAQLCTLAYIKAPDATSEHAAEAKATLAQLLGSGAPFVARVVSRTKSEGVGKDARHPRHARGKLTVALAEAESGMNPAMEMLCAGMASLPRPSKIKDSATRDAVQKLEEYQDEARQAHRGIFVYGDPGDSDDEAPAAPKPSAWGKPR